MKELEEFGEVEEDIYKDSPLGYMPKRGDFETEYDPDAENLLQDIEILEDDNEEE